MRRASRTSPPCAGAVDVPIAADESIRRAADPYRVRDLEAADVAVLKVQPLGGVRACLRIAEDIGLPVVVSSALETSVGIAAGVALAAALPELPLRLRAGHRAAAHRRRRGRPAAAGRRRTCPCGAPDGRPRPRSTGSPPRRTGWRTGRPGWRGPRSEDRPVSATDLARAVVHALVEAGVTEVVVSPGLAQRAAVVRRVDAAEAGAGAAAHPHRRAHARASSPSG